MFAFGEIVRDLRRVFPKRMDDHELRSMDSAYFHALRRFSIPQLRRGAEAWLQRGKYFPKPAEWIDAIPRQSEAAQADLPVLSASQAAEYLKAEQARYQGQPCACLECRHAGVTDKPLRFVPEFNEDDTDRKVKCGERIVTAGHWAHGAELARWYQAKSDFYEAYYAALAKKTMPKSGRRQMPALPEAS
jgi:hypothetical protein